MARAIDKILKKMRSGSEVRFAELSCVCDHCFGAARQQGTSHKVYKTPWRGDPRVNIQEGKGGKAKAYQVQQVLLAIDRLTAEEEEED